MPPPDAAVRRFPHDTDLGDLAHRGDTDPELGFEDLEKEAWKYAKKLCEQDENGLLEVHAVESFEPEAAQPSDHIHGSCR
jgi:hypothetical protein